MIAPLALQWRKELMTNSMTKIALTNDSGDNNHSVRGIASGASEQ